MKLKATRKISEYRGVQRDIFANLLLNSARYTERCGRIVLTLDREGDEAVMIVEDNGS